MKRNVKFEDGGRKMGRTKYIDRLLFRSGTGKEPSSSGEHHVTEQRSDALELWRELVSIAGVEWGALCWVWRAKPC